jgi:hypothetical protein
MPVIFSLVFAAKFVANLFPQFSTRKQGKRLAARIFNQIGFLLSPMIIDRRLVESVLKNNANLAFKGCSKNRRGIFARPCKGSPFCPVFLATQKNRSPVGRDRRTLKQSIDPKQTRQDLNG